MDYRELLKKYMDHVADCEGVFFLSNSDRVKFTDEEWKELEKIIDELENG